MINFISGNKFKKICDYSFEGTLIKNTNVKNDYPIFFVKTNLIDSFFNQLNIESNFKIITHNSDHSINKNHLKYLEIKNLIQWYSQNMEVTHEKLKGIPIGIANEIWEFGNEKLWKETIEKKLIKDNLIYSNFTIKNNISERELCFKKMCENQILTTGNKKFTHYLDELSKSFFSVCPNGNGIDTHRLWESLYLKTIPIVTKSTFSEYFQSLYPIIVIDSWNDFNKKNYSIDLYNELMSNYNLKLLDFDFYKNNILKW